MNTLTIPTPTQASMFPLDAAALAVALDVLAAFGVIDGDLAWFAAHPAASRRCRLPRARETEGADDGKGKTEGAEGAPPVRLMIISASGEKRAVAVREGPIPAGARWMRFGHDGEVLDP